MPSRPVVPTTKVAKARTIFPSKWVPLVRISLVDETFKAREKTVEINSMVGKTENSRGSLLYMTIRIIIRLRRMFIIISPSRRKVGRGIISMTTTASTPTATSISLFPDESNRFILSCKAMSQPLPYPLIRQFSP